MLNPNANDIRNHRIHRHQYLFGSGWHLLAHPVRQKPPQFLQTATPGTLPALKPPAAGRR
jgi:hypothetical protein